MNQYSDGPEFVRPPLPGLQMPHQAEPVQRSGARGGSTAVDGVEADDLLDSLGSLARVMSGSGI